ncbi:DUF1801 domain-containing protein [Myroides sp. LJL116]
MAKNKTMPSSVQVKDFINSFCTTEQKKEEAFELIDFFQNLSGLTPTMWGPSIIGFGSYSYTYQSGHSGQAPILGFSPRKAAFSLYVYSDTPQSNILLQTLGKYKMGKSCIYVNKLKDIDLEVLGKLCQETIKDIHHRYKKP